MDFFTLIVSADTSFAFDGKMGQWDVMETQVVLENPGLMGGSIPGGRALKARGDRMGKTAVM